MHEMKVSDQSYQPAPNLESRNLASREVWYATLKELCHAIWYTFKKLNGIFASIESQK